MTPSGIRTAYGSSEIETIARGIGRKPDSRRAASGPTGVLMIDNPETAATACTCLAPWPALTTIIEGTTHPVVPAPAHTPASALYLARCTRCGAAYTGPWKRLTSSSRAA